MIKSDSQDTYLLLLQKRLNYQFKEPNLLRQALTHRSYGGLDNERLEFLGDSILGAVISDILYIDFPEEKEGALTRLRTRLVRGTTLTQVANDIQLGESLHLGEGERKTGGRLRASNLANALEAIIGSIYLDGGYSKVRAVISVLFETRIRDLPPAEMLKDAKTRLQEWLQANGLNLPSYELVERNGPDHAQTFYVTCRLDNIERPYQGEGSNRRSAEQAAAAQVLAHLTSKNAE